MSLVDTVAAGFARLMSACNALNTAVASRQKTDQSNVTTAATVLDGTETVVVLQDAAPKKSALSLILDWITSTANSWAAKQTFAAGVVLPDTAKGNAHSVKYTPSAIAITNVSSITTYPTIAVRGVDGVMVGSRVDVNATAAGRIVFRLSLPVASNITSSEQVAGNFHVYTTGSVVAGGCISGLAGTNDAEFRGVAAAAGNASYWYIYIYQVN